METRYQRIAREQAERQALREQRMKGATAPKHRRTQSQDGAAVMTTDADRYDTYEALLTDLAAVKEKWELSYRLTSGRDEITGGALDDLGDLIGKLKQEQALFESAATGRTMREDAADLAWHRGRVV